MTSRADNGLTGPILFLVPNPELPSFRYRIAPVIDTLRAAGIACEVDVFPKRRYGLRMWEASAALRAASLVVLVKFQITRLEAAMLRCYARHLALDVDDAIYVRKPRSPLGEPDDTRWRRAKFAATCRAVDLVIAGSNHLAGVARAHARRVEIVPTPLDWSRYCPSIQRQDRPPRIVWVGMPENLIYVEPLLPVITGLQLRWPELKLRVVCSRFPPWPDTLLERVTWSPDSEVSALADADIGIMPLTNNEWTRGKCAFKLLQYMAAALPCVASPVGANNEVIVPGETGFLAGAPEQWSEAFATLLSSAGTRALLGAQGRARVREHYDISTLARRTAALLTELAASPGRRRGVAARTNDLRPR